MKPKIFIGSSSESDKILEGLFENLEKFSEPVSWQHDIFKLSKPMLTSLEEAARNSDFAVFIFGRDDVEYVKCSDEHGVIADPDGVLKVNDKLRLVPGHCDPTCNVHDWYVGVRDGKVEVVWPVSARGKAY